MKLTTERYLIALHQIQHTLLMLEQGQITPEIAERDVDAVARHVPRLHTEWVKEINK